MAKQVISLRVEQGDLEWLDGYAAKRGVSRQVLLEAAIESFKDDCARGVPDLKELVRQSRPAVKPGECVCPDLTGPEDRHPVRGFRQACPVHGAAVRADGSIDTDAARAHLVEATGARTDLFARLRTPESIKAGRQRPAKRDEGKS